MYFLLLPCGKFVLHQHLFRLFHLPPVDEKSTFPKGEGFYTANNNPLWIIYRTSRRP